MEKLRARPDIVFPVSLIAIVAALFIFGAPANGSFSWSDSPRHALNGAFVLDLLRDLPFGDPAGYAYDYYAKYPALTILFYPPLFYAFLAPFYFLLGVSQETALVAEFVCYAALAWGSYRFMQFWLEPLPALGASLILISAPELAFWGRQVMLEIPSFALMVWSGVFFMRHLREERTVWLYISIALIVLAMYTKISTAYVCVAYLICLLQTRGAHVFRDRHSYIIAGVALISLIPLIVLTLKFGQANIQSVGGIADSKVSRASIDGWIWYAKMMPSQLGWPALIAAIIGLLATFRSWASVKSLSLPLLWLSVGYLFFSAIDLKEARHSVFLLLPLSLFAVLGLKAFLSESRAAGVTMVALGVVTLGITVLTRPVAYVAGYNEVADFIAAAAPKNSVVVFSGYRDGSFVFAMRAHEERRDISVVRADKLLLNVAVRRELGVEEKDIPESKIPPMLDQLGAHYIVAQPGFWTDLEAMRRFENVLNGAHFEPIKRFVISANYEGPEKELVIYRNKGDVAEGPVNIRIDLPIINGAVSGTIGGER